MLITNAKQKRQINCFIDKDHKVMGKFYEIIEKNIPDHKMVERMQCLIEQDPDFYDPYLKIAEVFFAQSKDEDGSRILQNAYERSVTKIADSKGRWPKDMSWGFLKNRHIMRAIEQYAILCWETGEIDKALDIFRRLLRMNPEDNQGARFSILAIKLGLDIDEWQEPFEYIRDGVILGLDFIKVQKWFLKNAQKFSEEFQWLIDFHEDNKRTLQNLLGSPSEI